MFDPTLKSDPGKLKVLADEITHSPVFTDLLKDTPNILMILNEYRQVVYLNRNPVQPEKVNKDEAIGDRPGECLGCINIHEGTLGCGSSEFCRVCGFNLALDSSEGGNSGREECNIALKNGTSMNLSVYTRPFTFKGNTFTFCALEDISEKKRRQMLESIFLHDILNTAAVLNGLSETYNQMPEEEIRTMLKEVSAGISDEVQSYRLINSAESQSLQPEYKPVVLSDITNEVIRTVKNMKKFKGRIVNNSASNEKIITERTLLRRVLINLVKNALEAGGKNDTVDVTAFFDNDSGNAYFTVKNPQVIPRADQLKLFQKSFSTKNRGRGWGTYSIKILTEQYLRGSVDYTSTTEQGTSFTIAIPSLDK